MTHPNEAPYPNTDAELVERTRRGDVSAYAELWHRHASSGRAAARSFTGTFDPDDLVSEAFTRIFRSIRAGGGPTTAFRAYLVRTIQNVAVTWSRRKRPDSLEHAESLADPNTDETAASAGVDRQLVARAFELLPERWRQVLWYTEVEGMNPRDIAPILGMSANSVSALAYRAKEGLRQAWIQAHLSSTALEHEHRWTIERLGQYMRKKIAKREREKVEAHLDECDSCSRAAAEARRVEAVLPWALLPLIGSVGASTYALWSADANRPEASQAPADAHPSQPTASTSTTPAPLAAGGHGSGSLTRGVATAAAVVVTGSVIAILLTAGQGSPGPGTYRELPEASASQGPDRPEPLPEYTAEPTGQMRPDPLLTPPPRSPLVPVWAAPPAIDTTLSTDHPAPPSRPTDAPVISHIDTGPGSAGLWYPVAFGIADPGAVVTVSNGRGSPVQVIAGPDGAWSTGQLTGYTRGTHELTAQQMTAAGAASPVASSSFSLAAEPEIGAIVEGRLVSYAITSSTPGTVQIRIDADGDWFEAELGEAGEWYRWDGTASWGPLAGAYVISARFGSGDRWGPTVSMRFDLPAAEGNDL